jgi:arginine N-succinyltransferase
MLRRIGFHYAWRVDPFDGGPHFTAPTDEVTLVQRSHEARLTGLLLAGPTKARALVAVESPESPFFRAAVAPWQPSGDGGEIGEAEAALLGVRPDDKVWVLPLE